MLGAMLLSTINLAYYQELMAGMRAAIERGVCRLSRRDDGRAGNAAISALAPSCRSAGSLQLESRSL